MHLERRATVARIEGEFALLKLSAQAGCGACSQPGGCASGLLNGRGGACALQRVPNPQGAGEGEEVMLVSPAGGVWRAALVWYGLPLVSGLGAAAMASPAGDGAALLAWLAGLVAGWGVSRRIARAPMWLAFAPFIRRLEMEPARQVQCSKDVKEWESGKEPGKCGM